MSSHSKQPSQVNVLAVLLKRDDVLNQVGDDSSSACTTRHLVLKQGELEPFPRRESFCTATNTPLMVWYD